MAAGFEGFFRKFEFSMANLAFTMQRRDGNGLIQFAGIHEDVFLSNFFQLEIKRGRFGFENDFRVVRGIQLKQDAHVLSGGDGVPGNLIFGLMIDAPFGGIHVQGLGRQNSPPGQGEFAVPHRIAVPVPAPGACPYKSQAAFVAFCRV